MRTAARVAAETLYREALSGLFGFIEDRIDWRRAHAALLALEAQAMADMLADAPGFIAFRKSRIRTWRAKYRKHAARAWAQDCLVAAACGVLHA